jgi:hypothetical protein
VSVLAAITFAPTLDRLEAVGSVDWDFAPVIPDTQTGEFRMTRRNLVAFEADEALGLRKAQIMAASSGRYRMIRKGGALILEDSEGSPGRRRTIGIDGSIR